MLETLAVAAATPLIKKLVGGSLKDIAGSGVSKKDATSALWRLVNTEILSSLPADGNITKTLINKITSGIRKFQKQGSLNIKDGLLNPETIQWILETCNGVAHGTLQKDRVDPPSVGKVRWARYYIKPGSLPKIDTGKKPQDLLFQAWGAWAEHIRIDVLKVSKLKESNILIHSGEFDGPGGTLADATVGPPNQRRNDIKFDSSESITWEEDKFLYTCIHEIGHVLGLQHTAEKGQIMSTVRQKGLVEPTKKDIENLLKVRNGWWKPRPKTVKHDEKIQKLKDSGSTPLPS
ncbi:MAG: matrixin family metalloprotease [Planctomycetes bacterium]|nr:matrixin family metalloprotease [Planctomycetota bacterium]